MRKEDYFLLNPWWEGKLVETGVRRDKYLAGFRDELARRQIEFLVGGRRVGKTVILKQMVEELLENGVLAEDILYVACDFSRALGMTIGDHLRNFRQIFNHKIGKKLYIFLDEVQEIGEWQGELKSIYDSEDVKIFASGSTSALIMKHGGKLTGRQVSTMIYPLDFEEFVRFRRTKITESETYLWENEIKNYLEIGGYPENVLKPSIEYLSALLDDVLARDLLRLYPVKNFSLVRDLYKLVAGGMGTRVSYNRLAKILGVSLETVKDYVGYFEEVFLIKKLERWTMSPNERVYSAKKIYLADNGMKTLSTGIEDWGAKAENAVFWQLVREKKEIGYFNEGDREVDFVAQDGRGWCPIEVKFVGDEVEIEPKLKGLKRFGVLHGEIKRAVVVTESVDETINLGKMEVELVPLWRFLRG